MKRVALIALAFGCQTQEPVPPPPVAAPQPYSAAQLANVVFIAELEIAPDGTEVAFVSDRSGSFELWTAAVPRGEPRQRTSIEEQVSQLAYAPNGDLFFASDFGGDERTDLWLLARGAPEPVRFTTTKVAEVEPVVSPDGRHLAYGADSDRPFRFNLFVMDLATKVSRQLTRESVNVRSPAWSRDGRTLVGTVSPDGQKGELLVIDVASGQIRRIKPPQPNGILRGIEVLANGLLLASTLNAKGFDQLALVDLDRGDVRFVGPDDWDVQHADVALDGRLVYVRNVRGDSEVASTTIDALIAGGPTKSSSLVTGGVVTDVAVAASGGRVAVLRESSNRPAEIIAGTPERLGEVPLVPPAASDVDLSRLAVAERFETQSFDGQRIDSYVWRPTSNALGTPPPAVVRVHGGPSAQTRPYFSPEAQLLAGRGFLVVAPNYRGSTGYGRAFEDLNNKDWGGGDLRDLIAVVDALAARGDLDRTRVGITGGSYGGFMTLRAITATPTAWAAAVESYGMPDLIADYRINSDRFGSWYETEMGTPKTHEVLFKDRSPIFNLEKVVAPLLVFQGANDSNVPKWESDLVVDALQKHGRVVDYVVYPNEGHGFTHRENRLDAMQRTAEFFGQHLAARVRPETAR